MNENEYIQSLVRANPGLFKAEKIQINPNSLIDQLRKAFKAGAKSIVPTAPKEDVSFEGLFDSFFNGKGKEKE